LPCVWGQPPTPTVRQATCAEGLESHPCMSHHCQPAWKNSNTDWLIEHFYSAHITARG
jgi:hypothetical protein